MDNIAKMAHDCDFEGLFWCFFPMVCSIAGKFTDRKYGKKERRGVTYEELVQEGCVAVLEELENLRNHGDLQWLRLKVKRRAAQRIARAFHSTSWNEKHALVDWEALDEILPEGETERLLSEAELMDMLRRILTDEELDIAEARLSGATQEEIAKNLNISQPALAKKQKKIKEKIRGCWGE